jgi:hypothetical protein
MTFRIRTALLLLALACMLGVAPFAEQGAGSGGAIAQHAPATAAAPEETPEMRYNRRYPQKAKVGDLIGLPVLDDGDVTLGHVQKIVRTPAGKIELIVSYSKWFGWFGRPVAVPIEVVAILGRQIASVDMPPKDYAAAPTWTPGAEQTLSDNDTIRIALTRR